MLTFIIAFMMWYVDLPLWFQIVASVLLWIRLTIEIIVTLVKIKEMEIE